MKRTNWREIVEVVGVVSVVATLLLLAGEMRESNRVARTEVKLRLAESYAAIHATRVANPDFAQLFLKIEAPDRHLITATDQSRMQALAQHLGGVYRSVQLAYDQGLLDETDFAWYVDDIARTIDTWPGLHEDLMAMYLSLEDAENAGIFAPVAKLVAETNRDTADSGAAASDALPEE